MKRLIITAVALCLAAGLAFAAEPLASATSDTSVATPMTIKGTVIDNLCAGANSVNIAEFVKTHPKSCALMPDCAASGYSIYADGKLTKFDKDSSAKVEEFLKKADSKTEVVIEAEKSGDELKLVSINNQ